MYLTLITLFAFLNAKILACNPDTPGCDHPGNFTGTRTSSFTSSQPVNRLTNHIHQLLCSKTPPPRTAPLATRPPYSPTYQPPFTIRQSESPHGPPTSITLKLRLTFPTQRITLRRPHQHHPPHHQKDHLRDRHRRMQELQRGQYPAYDGRIGSAVAE